MLEIQRNLTNRETGCFRLTAFTLKQKNKTLCSAHCSSGTLWLPTQLQSCRPVCFSSNTAARWAGSHTQHTRAPSPSFCQIVLWSRYGNTSQVLHLNSLEDSGSQDPTAYSKFCKHAPKAIFKQGKRNTARSKGGKGFFIQIQTKQGRQLLFYHLAPLSVERKRSIEV